MGGKVATESRHTERIVKKRKEKEMDLKDVIVGIVLAVLAFLKLGNPQDGIKWHVFEIPGEVLVSLDGNTVVCRDGGRYDTPVDKKTVDKLNEAYQDFVAQGVAAGIIKTDYEPSEVEKQLKADLEEMERKQEERQKRDRMIAEQRADLSRGHRRIQYKWTNTPSTHTTLCPVCNEFRQPHTHPVNDGRH